MSELNYPFVPPPPAHRAFRPPLSGPPLSARWASIPLSVSVLALTLLAFALRCHDLAAVTLRWDEGWSIALARLPVADLVRITGLDVHPPLYYLWLKAWLFAGSAPEYWLRFPSVLAATAAVPLAAVAADAWWRTPQRPARWAGLFAAAYAALSPSLLYYAGVTRMYALTAPLLLAATWGLARVANGGGRRPAAIAILGAVAALYSFYYAGFAVAGLYLAALLAWPQRWRRLVALGTVTALLFLPWAAYAVPSLLNRAAQHAGGASPLANVALLLDDGLTGALFVAQRGPGPALLTLAVVLAGALLAQPRLLPRLGVVALPVLASLAGAAAGAGVHMFAPRYVVVAAPFLALGVGRGLAGLWRRGPIPGVVGAGLVLATVLPLYTNDYVFQRTAEVTDAFDPAADWRALESHTLPGDVVAFNILSLAGLYDRYRSADDPPWTYAQLWDPVHEPLDGAVQRLTQAAAAHDRLWLVLYQGTISPDSAAAKAWADTHLFPLDGWWRDSTLYQGYITAPVDRARPLDVDFGHGIRLSEATYSSRATDHGGLGLQLTWQAMATPDAKARVFVHAYAADGTLVAQHDAFPVADTRPQTTWQAGEVVTDRHGLWLPPGTSGPLTLKVGLYDPNTGDRWRLADGSDGVTLGRVEISRDDGR